MDKRIFGKYMFAGLVCTVMFFAVIGTAVSRPIVIKLGTPTPEGSPWNDILQGLASEWKEISGGRVQMKIFPGGIAGDELDMIRKMRINTIQGAVISGVGLNGISPLSMILSLPFFIRSEEEFDYVFERVKEDLENDIRRAGFTMVGWTRAGWMYFFSRDPVVYPKDLQVQKIAAADTDMVMAPALKAMGFHTVSLTLNEIMSGLVSGMIDACYTVPMGAVAYQWFGIANHMCDLPIAPAIGGIIISNRTWRSIPEDIRGRLKQSTARTVEKLHKLNNEVEEEVMSIMLENGLKKMEVPAEAVSEWRKLFEQGFLSLAGKAFPLETYENIEEYLTAYRSRYP